MELVLRRDDVEVVAICDIDEQMLIDAKKKITKSGKKMPQIYTGDAYAWKKLLEKENLMALRILMVKYRLYLLTAGLN